MVEKGNPNSITDAGVGALCARAAVIGAGLNVRINASGYHDKLYLEGVLAEVDELIGKTIRKEDELIKMVNKKIS
jgi:glutamate formiminotransferase/formiminotetrahydrofolate cyclodeaminase